MFVPMRGTLHVGRKRPTLHVRDTLSSTRFDLSSTHFYIDLECMVKALASGKKGLGSITDRIDFSHFPHM